MEKIHIIKIGGNVIDDAVLLNRFLKDFSNIKGYKLLVHGGGKLATHLAATLGIEQTMVEGRRVTDAKTLEVTVMVYAGLINKKIVAGLQALNCNAMGFCGADGNLITANKRENTGIDFGFVGDVSEAGINVKQLNDLLQQNFVPVISPITHDGKGNLLNTNADSLVTAIAIAMQAFFEVSLTYCFEKKGVLLNATDEESFIPLLRKQTYLQLKAEGVISKGMVPKLDNAFSASGKGIKELVICHAETIKDIETRITGTYLAV